MVYLVNWCSGCPLTICCCIANDPRTSHKRQVVKFHQPLDCLVKSLSRLITKTPPKLYVTSTLCGDPPVVGGIPAQTARGVQNVPCHDVIVYQRTVAAVNAGHKAYTHHSTTGMFVRTINDMYIQPRIWSQITARHSSIVSDHCLTPTRRQAIIWTTNRPTLYSYFLFTCLVMLVFGGITNWVCR